MSALTSATPSAKLRAAQRQMDREAAARARAERKPTLIDDIVNALPDLGGAVPDLFGGGGDDDDAAPKPMTYDEIMRGAVQPQRPRAAEELDDDEDDSDSGDETFMEAQHRNRLREAHVKELARLDASAMTYEEALAAARDKADATHAEASRELGSPVTARKRGFTEEGGPACLVPAAGAADVDDVASDDDDFADDGDAEDHYLSAQSPHEEQDWQINKLSGRVSPAPASVLPPNLIEEKHPQIVLADGTTVALEQLDERRYQPAPKPSA